jgi:tRNA-splicing ligase RtcB
MKIRGNDLLALGYVPGRPVGMAIDASKKLLKTNTEDVVLGMLKDVLDAPEAYVEHEYLSALATMLVDEKTVKVSNVEVLLETPLPYVVYGKENIEQGAIDQMDVAMSLPISRRGALMPDAHAGYGLPIGGVLACENAVIPYGVGVDIGCRMCMSIYNMEDDNYIDRHTQQLKKALIDNTRFGMVDVHADPAEHEIFDRPIFNEIKLLKSLKDKAWTQLGTSGGGNHFVEFGTIEILKDSDLGLAPGKYVAVLSHSGSRGFGARIADYYTKIAKDSRVLPRHAGHLAWLDMDSNAGQEYWIAMNLALDYASACHHDIHRRLTKYLGSDPLIMIENHHNFAAKEIHDGVEYIVHRKGATPASENEFGIIPGTMADFGYIVRGLGAKDSLSSASHGAGRAMSRSVATNSFTKSYVAKYLNDRGIVLAGGGVDEHPEAYKKIDEVMEYQKELVESIGRFYPKVVRMAEDEGKKKW